MFEVLKIFMHFFQQNLSMDFNSAHNILATHQNSQKKITTTFAYRATSYLVYGCKASDFKQTLPLILYDFPHCCFLVMYVAVKIIHLILI